MIYFDMDQFNEDRVKVTMYINTDIYAIGVLVGPIVFAGFFIDVVFHAMRVKIWQTWLGLPAINLAVIGFLVLFLLTALVRTFYSLIKLLIWIGWTYRGLAMANRCLERLS